MDKSTLPQSLTSEKPSAGSFVGYLKPNLGQSHRYHTDVFCPLTKRKQLWTRLRQTWHITDGYWYPLADCPLANIGAFQDRPFYEAVPPESVARNSQSTPH